MSTRPASSAPLSTRPIHANASSALLVSKLTREYGPTNPTTGRSRAPSPSFADADARTKPILAHAFSLPLMASTRALGPLTDRTTPDSERTTPSSHTRSTVPPGDTKSTIPMFSSTMPPERTHSTRPVARLSPRVAPYLPPPPLADATGAPTKHTTPSLQSTVASPSTKSTRPPLVTV